MLVALNNNGAIPTASSLFNAVRLKRIQIWYTSATPTPPNNTISITWAASNVSAFAMEVSDTALSAFDIAYVTSSPPKNHPASFWLGPLGSDNLFYIQAPTGAIVDISVEGVLQDGVSSNAANGTVPFVGTVGTLYAMPLDNSSNVAGSRVYLPVGLQQIG